MAKKKPPEPPEDQPDAEDRLEQIERHLWRMAEAIEGIDASIKEINKELFRLTHLLEEYLKKK
jgi:hypothetical protein